MTRGWAIAGLRGVVSRGGRAGMGLRDAVSRGRQVGGLHAARGVERGTASGSDLSQKPASAAILLPAGTACAAANALSADTTRSVVTP